MSEEQSEDNEDLERDEDFDNSEDTSEEEDQILRVSGMYKNYFLDYASYVILERAVPMLEDGLKPVQRRILHSMREMEDGRYNKVANVIGNTMKYHPHGDASIGDAMVQLGQKNLLIDTQGNWGNILTGDRSAAPRYIEARLSKLALEIVFSPKVTEWQSSYDGRNKEPITFPVKFPLLLALGVEGIAVGLACKILPHNFIELIDACVAYLRGRSFSLVPDFPTAGMADFTNYNDGIRGGKVRVRAKINQLDKKTLVITEIPFSTTTTSLIESILKANDKNKIKVKKIEDNTAENVEIFVHLPSGVSPDKMIDALYAFTDCEVSISPNFCVIENDTPVFIGIKQMLKRSADATVELLKGELRIKKAELEESWHFASLEKIFIEKRIYRDIEECETWEAILETIHKGLKPHVKHLLRKVTDEDVTRLTEIRIKRISKFDSFKADELIKKLEEQIAEVQNHLDNIIDYAVDYFKNLKKKYGEGRERKTEIKIFDNIERTKVAVANAKLYVDRKEGFIGTGLKKSESEFVCDCSDIDDIIVIRKDGNMMVSKISSKSFVGKDILHVAVWKKGDKRTVYNMIYRDGKRGNCMMKRFSVTSITRDKEYPLTKGTAGSEILYLTANPNGEAETLSIALKPAPKLKKLKFELDFAELGIKGRGAQGNILTKNAIKKIEVKEHGVSTLGARKIWFDDTVQRLNVDGRGELLGAFAGDDRILTVSQSGYYKLLTFDLSNHFDEDLIIIEKWNPKKPLSVIYYDGSKGQYFVKRFLVEKSDKPVTFISEHEGSHLEIASSDWLPQVEVKFGKVKGKERPTETVKLEEFISVKGLKAQGNRLSTHKIKNIDLLEPLPYEEESNEHAASNDPKDEAEEVPLEVVEQKDESSKVDEQKKDVKGVAADEKKEPSG
ncbi:MAG: DNA gyrase/topoisomerase IV subunit A, partial [Flavobacteriales bacterium]|nr:DNA gyrase/topoisomerase IV subunit A [Flavobacteriales bacterium]